MGRFLHLSLLATVLLAFNALGQDTKPEPCPEVTILGPAQNLEIDQSARYSAIVDLRGFNRRISYKWSAAGGEIVGGDEATEINVKKKDKDLLVQVKVNGFRPRCQNVFTLSERKTIPPEVILLDSFYGPFSEFSEQRIEKIAKEMLDHKDQILWVRLGFDKNTEDIQRRILVGKVAEAFKQQRFMHDGKVVFAHVESDHNFIEFWRSTPNAEPPQQ